MRDVVAAVPLAVDAVVQLGLAPASHPYRRAVAAAAPVVVAAAELAAASLPSKHSFPIGGKHKGCSRLLASLVEVKN